MTFSSFPWNPNFTRVFLLQSGAPKGLDKSEVEIIRYQVLVPVSEVQVRQINEKSETPETGSSAAEQVPAAAELGPNYYWELTHLRNQTQRRTEKNYLLSNSTPEFRNAFLKNIRHIIRESVRNMSLPLRITDTSVDSGTSSLHSHYATPEGVETGDGTGVAKSSSAAGLPITANRQAQTLGKVKV